MPSDLEISIPVGDATVCLRPAEQSDLAYIRSVVYNYIKPRMNFGSGLISTEEMRDTADDYVDNYKFCVACDEENRRHIVAFCAYGRKARGFFYVQSDLRDNGIGKAIVTYARELLARGV